VVVEARVGVAGIGKVAAVGRAAASPVVLEAVAVVGVARVPAAAARVEVAVAGPEVPGAGAGVKVRVAEARVAAVEDPAVPGAGVGVEAAKGLVEAGRVAAVAADPEAPVEEAPVEEAPVEEAPVGEGQEVVEVRAVEEAKAAGVVDPAAEAIAKVQPAGAWAPAGTPRGNPDEV